tara:strand:- start:72 stop:521 length:450 start_codon:yes stop_codon:yes gene_type:complete
MDIEGYEGLYKIYNDGKIWGCKRKKFIIQRVHINGYIEVQLCKNGKMKAYKVHRLMGIYYIPNPNNYKEIDHINRIKTDNRIDNLRWCDRFTNTQNTCVRKDNKINEKNISLIDNRYFIRIRRYNNIYRVSKKTLEEAILQRDLMLSMW